MSLNTIPKNKLNPLDRLYKQKNNYDLQTQINYDSYLKHPPLKENNNDQPKYFYQRKKVVDTKNIKNNYSKLHGSKHYPIPLIKNKPVINQNEEDKINVDNFIRGECSRDNNDEFKIQREGIEDLRFQYLNKNFQDPDKLVLPFPRGGEMTREKYNKNIDFN